MSYFPVMNAPRVIKPEGNPSARIAIVGDYTSAFDDNALRPFQGTGGNVLEQCLHQAGLIRGEVYLTHCIKSRPSKRFPHKGRDGPCPEYFLEGRGVFTPAGQHHVDALRDELNASGANVIVACGKAASVALCGVTALSAKRGYVFPSVGLVGVRKIIPTHHPDQAVRGMYTYRYMITHDLRKAKVEAAFRELIRPERQLVYEYSSVEEALQWLDYYAAQPELSVDIEVINYEVSCINFASDTKIGCVIPIADRWTEDEEVFIWRKIAQVLGNPATKKILQNAIFDIQFMLSRYGVAIRGEIHDTMIGHSCMYPELPKGLGFLGSIYCGAQAYWKDMVKFNDIKENS
jgi:DNA polymerase